jgi:heme exporter protein B
MTILIWKRCGLAGGGSGFDIAWLDFYLLLFKSPADPDQEADGDWLAKTGTEQSPMLKLLLAVVRRDLLLVYRRLSDVLSSLFFFVIVVSLFPLGIGPEPALLSSIAPGVIWIAALLATMLGLGRLFAPDYLDGTLEQMALAPQPLAAIIFGKVSVHWIVSGLPLVVLSPLLALQFNLTADSIKILVLTLLLGTPVLSMLGAIGAALTLAARSGSVLLALLVLPLYVPVLIFGTGAVAAEVAGAGAGAHLLLLGGILAGTLALAPWAVSAALRIAIE